MDQEIIDFYLQTSSFTELGLYKRFAQNLPDNINELCVLQRRQTIHPVGLINRDNRDRVDKLFGNLSEVPVTRLNFEEDYFPTALSMFAELLRLNPEYTINRRAKDKIHITCRGQAIMLAATLKAKHIPARVRSGFAWYVKRNGENADHWITEYYNKELAKWILVDADVHCLDDIEFDTNNISQDEFLTSAEAYIKLRKGKLKEDEISFASNPIIYGIKAAVRGLMYDYNALMNNEIILSQQPRYIDIQKGDINEDDLKELDNLAELLMESDLNFYKMKNLWENNCKFSVMRGGLN